jgi:hypothetical protein
MKKKNIKIGIIILSLLLLCVVGFFVYATIMTFGNQRMPIVEIPKELKELEKELQIETFDRGANFDEIPKYEIENCNAELGIYINNDSITKSKELLDKYVLSVNKRINDRLINKKCIDSLIIDISSYYSKAKTGVNNLKSKHYRYSFPVK